MQRPDEAEPSTRPLDVATPPSTRPLDVATPPSSRPLDVATTATGTVASLDDLRRRGKDLRATLGRRAHAELGVLTRDPVDILERQNAERLPDLVAVRMGRMLQSPFAFYRGTAALMAHDLSTAPVTGLQVVCCGDAHISNFGLYASPERRLLFDLNDFDEASNAPWEWDVKRLAASIVVGGRDKGLSDSRCEEIAAEAVNAYRDELHELFELSTLERYYFHVDTDRAEPVTRANARLVQRTVDKARRRTSEQVLHKMVTTTGSGRVMIADDPPLTRHTDHLSLEQLTALFEQYRATLRADTALVLSQFRIVDYVLRVVGVGSVGTRCYVVMLTGPSGDPLFLQVKEAGPSVLETHGCHRSVFDEVPMVGRGRQGHRVVSGQRILQAHSDAFLGWIQGPPDGDGRTVDHYVRQFRDMKGSLDTAKLSGSQFGSYVALCAASLARAHTQTPGAAVIAGYLGRSDRFGEAVARWAVAYADRTERDFATLEAAVRAGRVPAEYDV